VRDVPTFGIKVPASVRLSRVNGLRGSNSAGRSDHGDRNWLCFSGKTGVVVRLNAREQFRFTRVAWIAGALAAAGVAGLFVSVRAVAVDAATDPSPQTGDTLLEAENRGVPAAVVRRRIQVLAELAEQPAEEWAGEYFEGDGLGENTTLYLAPRSGISATWFGCMGLYGANEGDIERVDDRTLAFHFNRPNESGRFGMFPATVRVVRWGERRYLIPAERFIDFVNAINSGAEPGTDRYSGFLRRNGDESKPAIGSPDLPEEMLAQIRPKPLFVKVSSVQRQAQYDAVGGPVCPFELTFDAPQGEVLAPGLKLSPVAVDMYESARVVATHGQEVIAKILFFDACDQVVQPPTVGMKLTTGSRTY